MSKLVAVYGSLREGLSNHRLLVHSKKVYDGVVEGFAMYSLGGFPCIVPTDSASKPVVVEVYEVDEVTLRNLDRLEGYRAGSDNNFYERMSVEVHTGSGLVSALIYYMPTPYSARDRVSCGDWVRYLEGGREHG